MEHISHEEAGAKPADLIRTIETTEAGTAATVRPLGDLTRRELLSLAVESDTDPRSVAREIQALRGDGKHVRGRAGERIRGALAARGLLPKGGAR